MLPLKRVNPFGITTIISRVLPSAKALLMKKREMDESAAYAALRKAAMDSGRKISDVAEALLTADKLMGGF